MFPKPLAQRALFFVTVKLIRCCLFTLCHWRVSGRRHFPRVGGCVVAPNHISHLDPPVVAVAVNRPSFFMAKRELFSVPVLGPLIHGLGAFPVRRGVVDRSALRQAEQILRGGEPLMMFPEGTRSPDGRLSRPELGAAMLALRAGVPVVPVGIDGTDRALPRGSAIFRPAFIRVRIGEPLRFDDLYTDGPLTRAAVEEATRRIMAAIAALLPEWRGRSAQ